MVYEIALTAWQYQLPPSSWAVFGAHACAEAPAIAIATTVAVAIGALITLVEVDRAENELKIL